jgi:hypothetical protein
MAEGWEWDAKDCLETNLQHTLYYPFAMCAEYKYIQCGIKKKGIKMYYDSVLMGETTALRFRSFKYWDGVQKLVPSMPDDQSLGEWELHTPEVMRWNDNYQQPIKYLSCDIIKSMTWLMRQTAYAKHFIFAPQHCFNSNTLPKRLYIEMHTADWWWEV